MPLTNGEKKKGGSTVNKNFYLCLRFLWYNRKTSRVLHWSDWKGEGNGVGKNKINLQFDKEESTSGCGKHTNIAENNHKREQLPRVELQKANQGQTQDGLRNASGPQPKEWKGITNTQRNPKTFWNLWQQIHMSIFSCLIQPLWYNS